MKDETKKIEYKKEFEFIKAYRDLHEKYLGTVEYPSGAKVAKLSERKPGMCYLIVNYYKDMEINK